MTIHPVKRSIYLIACVIIWEFLIIVTPSHAIHISEGILPFGWAVVWFAIAISFIAWGLYDLKKRSTSDISFKPLVGLMAAVVFIISCMPIPVPTAGTCSHPCGTGLAAILLGPGLSEYASQAFLLWAMRFFFWMSLQRAFIQWANTR
jgi:cobalt/nickel transport system permease protein